MANEKASGIKYHLSMGVTEDTKHSLRFMYQRLLQIQRATKANAKEYREAGQELQAYRTQQKGFSNAVQQANLIEQQAQKNLKGLNTNTKDYYRIQKLVTKAKTKQTKAYNKQLQAERREADMNAHASNLYNQSTDRVVASLKKLAGKAQAGQYEFKRLSGTVDNTRSRLEAQQRVVDRMASNNKLADMSDRDAVAFEREDGKLSKLKTTYANQSARIKQLTQSYGGMSDTLARSVDKRTNKINKLHQSADRYNQSAQNTTGVSMALGGAFLYGSHQAVTLEHEFNKISVLLKNSGENSNVVNRNIRGMSNSAVELSEKYGVSQNEVASGFENLVRRGYSSSQALKSMKYYLQASATSGDDLTHVIDTAGSTMEEFDLRQGNVAKHSKTVNNELAYGADITASDFGNLGEAMAQVGPIAKNSNQSLSQTTAILGELSQKNISGSRAGKELQNMFVRLSTLTPKSPGLKALGLKPKDLQDSAGNLKQLTTIMGILHDRMVATHQTASQQNGILKSLFGQIPMGEAQVLVKHFGEAQSFQSRIQKSVQQNYIGKTANQNMNTTEGHLKQLQQTGEELAKSFAQDLDPAFKEFSDVGMNMAHHLQHLSSWQKKGISIIAGAIPVITAVKLGVAGVKSVHADYLSLVQRFYGIQSKNNVSLQDEIDLLKNKSTLLDTINTQENENTSETNENTGAIERANSVSETTGGNRRTKATTGNAEGNAVEDGAIGASSLSSVARNASRLRILKGGLKTGAGTGLMIGGTEALTGNVNGGIKDGASSTLGGVAGGALGLIPGMQGVAPAMSMIGSMIAPALSKEVGKGVSRFDRYLNDNHPKSVSNSHHLAGLMSPSLTTGSSNTLNSLTKSLNALTRGDHTFISSEVKAQQKATNALISNNGRMTNSAKNNFTKMDTLAKKQSDNLVKRKKKELGYLRSQGDITGKEYDREVGKVKQTANSKYKSFDSLEKKILSDSTKNKKQRYQNISKLNTKILDLTDTGTKKQKQLLSDLHNHNVKSTRKAYDAVISSSTKAYNSTKRNAKKTFNAKRASANKQYSQVKKFAKDNYGVHSKAYRDILGKAQTHRDNMINNAETQEGQTEAHARNQRIKVDSEARTQKNEVTGHAEKQRTGVVGVFDDIFDRLGEAVGNMKYLIPTKVRHGFHNFIHPLRSLMSLTPDAHGTPDTQALHFANGNLPGLATDQNSVVNDGSGRELVKLPNGQLVLPSGKNVHTVLPKGTSVFSAEQTRKILGLVEGANYHANGTDDNDNFSDGLNDTLKHTRKHMNGINHAISDNYDEADKKAHGHIKNIHDDAIKNYKDMSSQLQSTHQAMNRGLNSQLDTTVKSFKGHFSVIPTLSRSSMQGAVGNINSGIGSIDRALRQFGGNSNVLNAVHYANGTPNAFNNTLGILNDDSSHQQEAVVNANGSVRYPRGDNVLTALRPNDNVLNGSDTKTAIHMGLIPHYANGRNSLDALSDLAHGNAKHYIRAFNGEFDNHVTNSGSLLSRMLTSDSANGVNTVGTPWSQAMWGYISDLIDGDDSNGKRLYSLVQAELGSTAKKWIEKNLGDEVNNPVGSSVSRWRPYVVKALKRNGFEASAFQVAKWMHAIMRESGGNPRAINNWDSNAQAGHASRGLVQTIPSTFYGNAFAGHQNMYNGYDSLLAGIRYASRAYGRGDFMFDRIGGSIGYRHGGLSTSDKMAHISEGDSPEMVLPLTDKNRAVSLMLKSLKYMYGDNAEREANNSNGSDDRIVNELIRSNQTKDKQIEKISKQITILLQVIENKPVITETQIYKANHNQALKRQRLRNLNNGNF